MSHIKSPFLSKLIREQERRSALVSDQAKSPASDQASTPVQLVGDTIARNSIKNQSLLPDRAKPAGNSLNTFKYYRPGYVETTPISSVAQNPFKLADNSNRNDDSLQKAPKLQRSKSLIVKPKVAQTSPSNLELFNIVKNFNLPVKKELVFYHSETRAIHHDTQQIVESKADKFTNINSIPPKANLAIDDTLLAMPTRSSPAAESTHSTPATIDKTKRQVKPISVSNDEIFSPSSAKSSIPSLESSNNALETVISGQSSLVLPREDLEGSHSDLKVSSLHLLNTADLPIQSSIIVGVFEKDSSLDETCNNSTLSDMNSKRSDSGTVLDERYENAPQSSSVRSIVGNFETKNAFVKQNEEPHVIKTQDSSPPKKLDSIEIKLPEIEREHSEWLSSIISPFVDFEPKIRIVDKINSAKSSPKLSKPGVFDPNIAPPVKLAKKKKTVTFAVSSANLGSMDWCS
jgi:hypothetical protein